MSLFKSGEMKDQVVIKNNNHNSNNNNNANIRNGIPILNG